MEETQENPLEFNARIDLKNLQEAVEKIKSRYRYAIDKLRKCLEVIR